MNRSVLRFISGSLIAAFLLSTAFGLAAQTFEVTSTPVSVNHTLSPDAAWNIYRLTATSEQRVAYSMHVTTEPGCASLLFVKGHDLNLFSQYFSTYSQMSCVQRYSNTFPVDPTDGTDFTVLIETTSSSNVTYALEINILAPVIPRWTAGILIVLTLGLVPPVLWFMRRRIPRLKSLGREAPPPGI